MTVTTAQLFSNTFYNKLINYIQMLVRMQMPRCSCKRVELSLNERSADCRHADASWLSGYQTRSLFSCQVYVKFDQVGGVALVRFVF